MTGLKTIIVGLVPSLGLALLFWYVMRAVIRADRNERAAEAKLDAMDSAEDAQT
jgi:hypothetical protein